MNGPTTQELNSWREAIKSEIVALENKLNPLLSQLSLLRERLKAIETLASGNGAGEAVALAKSIPQTSSRSDAHEITPAQAYWVPILESLEERGGREHSDVTLDLVEKKMAHMLTSVDYEILPSGGAQRWRNRAQWQRQNMTQQGLLRRGSPRGIWEITPEGRKWLAQRKDQPK